MERNSTYHYYQILADLHNIHNITSDTFKFFNTLLNERDEQNRFGKPMMWIGIYIAIVSLFCILPMLADLSCDKAQKFWFPCKYFTLNAASLSAIAVAMKLPMDLNNPMLGYKDQAAKSGSIVFMITMMANLLPSLASMDGMELLTNIIALGVLVITMLVNVCIQLHTGVINSYSFVIATIDVIMLFSMLMIYLSSALTILKSKQILEAKYQACHEKALNDLAVQPAGRLTVEKLKQYVNYHWIMAVSGSPQLMVACSATSSAAGVICVITIVIYFTSLSKINNQHLSIKSQHVSYYESDYKWSTLVIFGIQIIGVLIGSAAPILRCYASLRLKVSRQLIYGHFNVFKVESYCTQKLRDWKQSSIPLSFKSRRLKVIIHNLKALILDFCIGLQMVIVVACKITSSIPVLFLWILTGFFVLILGLILICVLYCCKWFKAMFSALGFKMEREPEQLQQDDVELAEQSQQNEDLRQYVLQLQDDVELADITLKEISESVNHLIEKAEKQQPTDLMKLLERSSGFEGVGMCDMDQVPPSLADQYPDCWSLTVATLTTIAISLPSIQKDIVDKLLSSVSEGLVYITLVEESLNSTDDYVNIQKASKMMWLEVEVYHTWLGNNLQNIATQVNSAERILKWFTDTAKNLITEVENTNVDVPNDNSICRSVSANTMYRITQAILLFYDAYIDEISQEQLFMRLSSMISDILAACLTNLPQVIALKCHTNAIEKREASVHAAAQLLGQATKIIDKLQDRELPNLNPAELPFIDKWRDYFKRQRL